MDDIAVKVKKLSKDFKLPNEKTTTIKSTLINLWGHGGGFTIQHALKNINFEIKKGEFFGIVGRNGSGKSTLLKIVAGIYEPSSGNTTVNGSLTPFIELGVGFNEELTGRENVYLNGALLGFSRKEMESLYKEIVSFAELEKFMDQKLKNYSSGMKVRLAFSIAIRANSDILLIDEVLAVGDISFQEKCYDYFREIKGVKNKTVIFVSHDRGALQSFCDRCLLINEGEILMTGKTNAVLEKYDELLKDAGLVHEEKRWGTGEIKVDTGQIINERTKKPGIVFTDKDMELIIKITFLAKARKNSPVYGITISNSAGQDVFLSNTMWSKMETAVVQPGERVSVIWKIPNLFNSGTYYISPAVSDQSGLVTFDWRTNLLKFKIEKKNYSSGSINIAHRIYLESTVPKKEAWVENK